MTGNCKINLMKRLKYLVILVVLLINTISCKKSFLDVEEKSKIVRQVYVSDLNSTNDFLNGIYIVVAQDFYQGPHQIYAELSADNIKLVSASATSLPALYNWSQQANINSTTTNNMNGMWRIGYQIIRSCSFALEKAEEYRSQDPDKADNMKAQAYGLRALIHFELGNVFSQSYDFTTDGSHPGIPYVTTSDWTESVKRNSVSEVYSNIINDLNAAISLFASGATNVLYMNKNAAKALLARVYLFKGDYVAAKNLAREVATSVPIMTNTPTNRRYPDSLFRKGETEALFQLMPAYSVSTIPGGYTTNFQGRYFVSPKNFVATADIGKILTENSFDLRRNWVTLSGGVYSISKYPQNVIGGFSVPSASYYQTLLRSSEMYLTTAEAYAKLNNEDSARFYLDEIRKRANSTVLSSTATGPALLDSIYKERRKELAFEGFRVFDLLRWKKGVDRTDAWSASAQSLSYPSNKIIAPIPQNDAEILGLAQNLDY